MSRRSSNFDLSIRGDELEQNRIQLEHNLQHTDLSLHLSSTPEDFSDVEYPRHNSAPSPFSAFASFEQRSGDHFEPSEHSQYHAWSFRSFNQDESLNHIGGETVSTAAHHASALTLSAGLGGRGHRRDVSLSGAEYDPDRPLQGIMAGINSCFSALDADNTKSKPMASRTVDFDPLVVDDTAEFDRVLQSGHARLPSSMLRSPISSLASSSSVSEPTSTPPGSPSSRPKLTDALHAVHFSPKRPRSAQSQAPLRSYANSRSFSSPSVAKSIANPLDRSRPSAVQQESGAADGTAHSYGHQQSLSYIPADPEVNVQPATPSMANSSKFGKMARSLAQEIQLEKARPRGFPRDRDVAQSAHMHSTVRDSRVAKQGKERNPFQDIANQTHGFPKTIPTPVQSGRSKTPSKGRVHLPDVTGLTSAVGSPAKVGMEFYKFDGRDDGENEARLFATLNVVQSKLAFLETENSISRRRVHELELELEACKQEVARERTKVLQQEELVAQRAADVVGRERERLANLSRQPRGKVKPQNRMSHFEGPDRGNESRYKEAVEEKKALEALIATLRSHLSRLTAELSEHQRLLTDLRTLRDSDAYALAEKSKDVDKLRQEVERLAGEVEVLRGVVEEGLKERRNVREQLSRDLTQVSGDERSGESSLRLDDDGDSQSAVADDAEASTASESDVEEDGTSEHSERHSLTRHAECVDKTMRTDHATLGSSQHDELSTRPFVDAGELNRIAADVQERRSERSESSSSASSLQVKSRSLSGSHASGLSRCTSPANSMRSSRIVDTSQATHQECGNDTMTGAARPTASTAPVSAPNVRDVATESQIPSSFRPTTPTPLRALEEVRSRTEPKVNPGEHVDAPQVTPFPRIRGAHMERLFFSAPEHNTQTCTVCHRRRKYQRAPFTGAAQRPFWLAGSRGTRNFQTTVNDEQDDEGYAEGPEDDDRPAYVGNGAKGKEPERIARQKGNGHKLPPQTVLARVVRELEDDFAHYKSIYVELADQYKVMDAVSNVAKRNVVAGHLREVIDVLEQKGDQIASLYDLLSFKDKPTPESGISDTNQRRSPAVPSRGRNQDFEQRHSVLTTS